MAATIVVVKFWLISSTAVTGPGVGADIKPGIIVLGASSVVLNVLVDSVNSGGSFTGTTLIVINCFGDWN